jgi:membrane protein DedA with SNARE-associated domain
MFPGDLLLIVLGLLLVDGRVSLLWLPGAYVAVLLGGATAYTWSRWAGLAVLHRLALKLRLEGHFERATARLQRTGWTGVVVGRLLPGTRIWTTLISGAAGMSGRAYGQGLALSSAIWMAVLVGLGATVGVPVEAHLRWLEAEFWALAPTLALSALVALCVRHLRPGRARTDSGATPVVLAIIFDVAIITVVALIFGDTAPVHWVAGRLPRQVTAGPVMLAGLAAAYVAVLRLTFRATAGELLTGAGYGRRTRRSAATPPGTHEARAGGKAAA